MYTLLTRYLRKTYVLSFLWVGRSILSSFARHGSPKSISVKVDVRALLRISTKEPSLMYLWSRPFQDLCSPAPDL